MISDMLKLLLLGLSGVTVKDLFITETNTLPARDGPHTPSNIWVVPAEDTIKVHWNLPEDTVDLRTCVLEYRPEDNQRSIKIPITKDQRWFLISGLERNTLYEIRLYCFYNRTVAAPTEWIGASTRTVSVDPEVCPGILPHASLEANCIRYPRRKLCHYTCNDGYRMSDVEDVMFGYRNKQQGTAKQVLCMKGVWVTYIQGNNMGFHDICLPEDDFQKCPLSIPNGALERHCGPATDWLCHFKCNEGYTKHTYMWGSLKNFKDEEYSLFCVNGTWKTGYEDIGLDVFGVCVPEGTTKCEVELPNLTLSFPPCWSGQACHFTCNAGFHSNPMADDRVFCSDSVWYLHTTKYDPSIKPQTVCVPNDSETECPRAISNGRVPDGCKTDCEPTCDEGYYWPDKWYRYPLTCEGGQWLTTEYAYNGDNICFPDDGHACPRDIPNGAVIGEFYRVNDFPFSRRYLYPICSEGFRKHRVMMLECVAGKWVTGQERFGLDVSAVCVSEIAEDTWVIHDYYKKL